MSVREMCAAAGKALGFGVLVLLCGCVTARDVNTFSSALDETWMSQNREILRQEGTRRYDATRVQALDGMIGVLTGLGMTVEEINEKEGFVGASAIGPTPLSAAEWDQVHDVEMPRTRDVAMRAVGPVTSMLVYLAPEEYRIYFAATTEPAEEGGTLVTLSARMRRLSAPAGTMWPSHPPPEAVRIGLAKIWGAFDARLAALGVDAHGEKVQLASASPVFRCVRADGSVVEASEAYCSSIGGTVSYQKIKRADSKRPSEGGGDASGTGFALSSGGYFLTNHHVAGECRKLYVQREAEVVPAKLIATDELNDLAVIKANLPDIVPVRFRKGSYVRPGDQVVAVGFPYVGILTSSPQLTTGNVTALAGIGDDTRFIQITAPIQPGNSGGPLFDLSGNIVGVVDATLNALLMAKQTGSIPQNINFAIKTSTVREFLNTKKIPFREAVSDGRGSVADVGEDGMKSVVRIQCKM